ncbi:MAG: glutaminase A [Verrucomicrobiota bacterium]
MENTISRIIGHLFDKYRDCKEGNVADYIPELTKADPEWFGISVFTVDGHGYSIGDCEQTFTIQSISKAFTYGMILDAHGIEEVEKRIGVEPSGEAFNSISLDPGTGRPFNPMINAGAIAATGMVKGDGFDHRFEQIRAKFSAYANNDLPVDEDVYHSESATGFRNRAIAYLLRNFGILDDPVEESVEVYFKQCSILVTCRDLALMAASLANGGINPVTQERVIQPQNVERVLSVMSTCGMYDYSGEWIFKVGLPAKSGVGGGVLGVLPGQLGVAVFSPRLDAKGNTVRGVRAFSELSKLFNLHLFNSPSVSGQVIRRVYKLCDVGSHRQRPKTHHQALREHGSAVTIIEMQGDLFFAAVERLVRKITANAEGTNTFILDFSRVSMTDRATEDLLLKTVNEQSAATRKIIFVDPAPVLNHERFHEEGLRAKFATDIDNALEHCENEIVKAHVDQPAVNGLCAFHDFEIFAGLTSRELTEIESLLEMETFPAGSKIVEQGAAADQLFLLAKGSVSIFHLSQNGTEKRQRVAAFSRGVPFGELSVIDGSPRSADVWADEDSTCYTFSLRSLQKLETASPVIHAKILRNILLINVDRLRRCNQEIASLKA